MSEPTRETPLPNTAEQHPVPKTFLDGMIKHFARHKVAANILMFIMMIAGIWSLTKLNTQFLPTFALDYISVSVSWNGATAEDIEKNIITPLEKELKDLANIKNMDSTAAPNVGIIVLEYQNDTDMSIAINDVKEKVSQVQNLPTDAKEPKITKIQRYEPIAKIIVRSDSSLNELVPWVRSFEKDLLKRGVAKIDFLGLPEEEVAIQIEPETLQQLNMSLQDIGTKIREQSQDIPAGTIGKDESARELRSLQQRREIKAFDSIPIKSNADGQLLTLSDIAVIEKRNRDREVEVYFKGQPSIQMTLQRSENADTLGSAKIMEQWLAEITPTLPASIQLEVFDQKWQLVEQRISLLINNGVGGLILVVAILFIFLNGRIAFWVTVGIPVSFIGTLSVLYLAGDSINMVTLFALIMALGIIVDDAIVVGEDTMTHFSNGESALVSAEGGARRMLIPVLSSSLTTIAAFLPLMLISGIMGNILFSIPLVIICVIVASLIECFLIMPGHLHHSLRKIKNHKRGDESKFRKWFDPKFEHFKNHKFRNMITWALNHRGITISSIFATFIFAMGLMINGYLNFTFFPSPEGDIFNVDVKFTAGTSPNEARLIMTDMQQSVEEIAAQLSKDNHETPILQRVIVVMNQANFDTQGRNNSRGNEYASMTIQMTMPDEREVTNRAFLDAWNAHYSRPVKIEKFAASSPRGGPPGSDIDVFLTGQNIENLKAAANDLTAYLKDIEGVSNIQDDMPYGKEQFIYELTPMGQSLGLTTSMIGQQLRAAFDGNRVQFFYDKTEEIEVRVLLPDAVRNRLATLDQFPIITPSGDAVPLLNVISFTSKMGIDTLKHNNTDLGVHITAEVDASRNNANTIMTDLKENILPDLLGRYSLTYTFKGRAEDQASTFSDLKLGAIIGLCLIYLILCAVFSSYTWPFAVMAVIPFGLTGAILGHWVMNIDLTLLSMFGFFGLSGIVINDSIILITFYKELRAQGLEIKLAIIEAACQRLRAVLLTSLTTIAGLTPLLFETSLQAQFLIPMAVSITFGLAFGTIIVLVLVPALLSLVEGALARFERFKHKNALHTSSSIP